MTEIIRDTVFGHIVRFISKGRLLQYAEERDPKLWKQYLDHEQTKNLALNGSAEGPPSEEKREESTADLSETSSRTRAEDQEQEHQMGRARTAEEEREHQLHSTTTGQRIDTEKGRDIAMVTWFGDDDPEVTFSH